MTKPWTGGCACGRLRYTIATEPVVSLHCQCRDCQHDSGTGHASHLVFGRHGATMTGEPATWDMTGDSGHVKTRGFCPVCGSAVYLSFAATPEVFTIRAATLDEPERFQPQIVTYAASGPGWDHLDPDLTKFAHMPPV